MAGEKKIITISILYNPFELTSVLYRFVGIPVRDIFLILIEEATHLEVRPDIDEVCATKKAFSLQTVAEIGTPRIEMVVDIARKYYGKVPLAVASSGYRDHVMFSLESNGILDLFDAVVTAEDIRNPKPAPDIFLLAAYKIGCDPTKCRGFEDADVGMQALHAAGMEAVDVRKLPGYPSLPASPQSVLEFPENAYNGPLGDGGKRNSIGKTQQRGTNVDYAAEVMGVGGSETMGFVLQAGIVALLAYGTYTVFDRFMAKR